MQIAQSEIMWPRVPAGKAMLVIPTALAVVQVRLFQSLEVDFFLDALVHSFSCQLLNPSLRMTNDSEGTQPMGAVAEGV